MRRVCHLRLRRASARLKRMSNEPRRTAVWPPGRPGLRRSDPARTSGNTDRAGLAVNSPSGSSPGGRGFNPAPAIREGPGNAGLFAVVGGAAAALRAQVATQVGTRGRVQSDQRAIRMAHTRRLSAGNRPVAYQITTDGLARLHPTTNHRSPAALMAWKSLCFFPHLFKDRSSHDVGVLGPEGVVVVH